MEIIDNGIGIDDFNINNDQSTGFGTLLIDLLVKQLDGTMTIFNGLGTRVSMEFEMSSKEAELNV